jgi:hypothetical protein
VSNSKLKTALKAALPAAALALAAFSAPAANATTVILDVGSLDHPRVVTIAGIGNEYSGPMHFTATWDGVPTTLLAWCVDVYHDISAADYSPNLTYTDGASLTTDFAGHALDAGDTTKIGLLANYGQDLYDTVFGTPHTSAEISDAYFRLAAVQAAIWQVSSNRNVFSSNATFDALVDNLSGDNLQAYFGGYAPEESTFTLITPVQTYSAAGAPLPLTQSFVIAQPVPEPAAWLLMIGGIGLMGAVLRMQRQLIPAVVQVNRSPR